MSLDESQEEGNDEFYDWTLVPKMYPPEKRTEVTFKGDTEEYFAAHTKIWKMFDIKGAQYLVNGVELRILDNAKNKPIKVEVKSKKGQSGKVNMKMYNVSKFGYLTMIISKTSDSNMVHVKTLSFKVCRYLLGGIIDEEIADKDIENMKLELKGGKVQFDNLFCSVCAKKFKTENGLNIHIARKHEESMSEDTINMSTQLDKLEPMEVEIKEIKCTVCDKVLEEDGKLNTHHTQCANKVLKK